MPISLEEIADLLQEAWHKFDEKVRGGLKRKGYAKAAEKLLSKIDKCYQKIDHKNDTDQWSMYQNLISIRNRIFAFLDDVRHGKSKKKCRKWAQKTLVRLQHIIVRMYDHQEHLDHIRAHQKAEADMADRVTEMVLAQLSSRQSVDPTDRMTDKELVSRFVNIVTDIVPQLIREELATIVHREVHQ